MIAVPAVDLRGRHGADGDTTPGLTARAFADLGFARLHLENFGSGTRGDEAALNVEDIVRETDAEIQIAGPDSGSEIERLFRSGAEYIVLGSRAVEEPEWLAHIAELYPDAIVVGTDVRDRRVVRRGWVRTLPVDVLDLVDELNALPLAGVLVSGLQLDGPTQNSDLALVDDLVERSRAPVIVAAKACMMNHLRALEHRGAAAAVIRPEQLVPGMLDPRAVAGEFGS